MKTYSFKSVNEITCARIFNVEGYDSNAIFDCRIKEIVFAWEKSDESEDGYKQVQNICVQMKGETYVFHAENIRFYLNHADANREHDGEEYAVAMTSDIRIGNYVHVLNMPASVCYRPNIEENKIDRIDIREIASSMFITTGEHQFNYKFYKDGKEVERLENCFKTYEEVTQWFGVPFTTIDGEVKRETGEFEPLVLTKEQREVIDQINALFAKAKELKIGFVTETDNERFTPFNAEHVTKCDNSSWGCSLKHDVTSFPETLFPTIGWNFYQKVWWNEGSPTFEYDTDKNEE